MDGEGASLSITVVWPLGEGRERDDVEPLEEGNAAALKLADRFRSRPIVVLVTL